MPLSHKVALLWWYRKVLGETLLLPLQVEETCILVVV